MQNPSRATLETVEKNMEKIAFLKNSVRTYAWGSRTFIPDLLGESSPSREPVAELWLGAHPQAPSQALVGDRWISLLSLIQKYPRQILGPEASGRFSGEIPFLFKVLAAAKPLSIQVHPDREQARRGYKRETDMKIPMNSTQRTYRDPNHKPEIICALTPFWALKGFRKAETILENLRMLELSALVDDLGALSVSREQQPLKPFFSGLMSLPKNRQMELVEKAVAAVHANQGDDPLSRWVLKLHQAFPGDIGCLSPLFLNLVQLQAGEAMFLPSGELHAYLDGAGLELMANSDNVLRGGLTPKHMDVPELLKSLTYHEGPVGILRPEQKTGGEMVYSTGAEEFVLSRITLRGGAPFESPKKRSIEIMICMEGEARIVDPGHEEVTPLVRGASVIVPAAVDQYRIEGEATLYKAGVPLN